MFPQLSSDRSRGGPSPGDPEDLGAPRDAALAFARARTLAPDGPLAEDALAREVEAWSRAGEIGTARVQALIYTQRYPQGRRAHAVRQFGGLESP